MGKVKYSEHDMNALIREVEDEFAQHLNKTEEDQTTNLEKSEEVTEEKVEKSEEVKEDFSYNKEDFAEMDDLYGSMSKSEAEAHYKSVKKAVFGSEQESEQKIETEVKVEKSEDSKEEESKLEKSEIKSDVIAKSEHEVVVKERDELKKSIENLTAAVGTFLKSKAPKRKAITNIEYVKKSEAENPVKKEDIKKSAEEMSDTEIKSALSVKIREGSLKKSDKDAINDYYLGDKSIEKIKYLL